MLSAVGGYYIIIIQIYTLLSTINWNYAKFSYLIIGWTVQTEVWWQKKTIDEKVPCIREDGSIIY